MKTARPWALTVPVGLALYSSAVVAQDTDQRTAFRAADRNGSAAVSMEEFRNYAIGAFYHVDADHDATVTPKEYAGIDKAVTIEDFNAALAAYFDQYDADHNGSLELSEWAAVPSADPSHPSQIKPITEKEDK